MDFLSGPFLFPMPLFGTLLANVKLSELSSLMAPPFFSKIKVSSVCIEGGMFATIVIIERLSCSMSKIELQV